MDHAGFAGAALFNRVLEENRRSNQCFEEIEAVRPGIFRRGEVSLTFDANRVIHLTLPGLIPVHRTLIQARFDLRFGPGLVVID